jgi:hypothetical protein
MILNAVLLTVAEISEKGAAKLPVAICPAMPVATGGGVRVVNPNTGFEMCLTGNVDYAVCTYTDVSHRGKDPS